MKRSNALSRTENKTFLRYEKMKTQKNKFADFKQRYIEAKTCADAIALVKELSQEEKAELNQAMNIVQKWTGLDMRQEFFNRLLAVHLEVRK